MEIICVAQAILRTRSVKRDQPRLLIDRQMQRRDVRETDKYLGVSADDIVIEVVDDSGRAVSSRAGKDRVDLWIMKRSH